MAALVTPHGYPLEEHFVDSDGYILRMFRIPHGRVDRSPVSSSPRPVVFMQHALLDSSAGYVALGPDKALGFAIADAGFDVWLGNVRGNRFSRNHSRLSPAQDAFWAFNWDDHALVDLPAMVQHVLADTQVAKLQYVGYSQGTTMAFAALSSLPALAARVSGAVLLAPVAFVTHMSSPVFSLMAATDTDKLFMLLGVQEFAGYSALQATVTSSFCATLPAACILWLGLLCGFNPEAPSANFDTALLPLMMHYLPAGTSVQNMAHWSQAVKSKDPSKLSRYDLGTQCTSKDGLNAQPCNQKAYGTMTPPPYNLSAITTPLALFTGGKDSLSTPQDLELLLRALPTGVLVGHHIEPNYAHLDFGLGMDAHVRVFPSVVEWLKRFASGQVIKPAAVAAPGGAVV